MRLKIANGFLLALACAGLATSNLARVPSHGSIYF